MPVAEVAKIVDEVFRNNFDFGDAEPEFEPDADEPYVTCRQKGFPFREVVASLTRPVDDRIVDALADQLIEDDYYRPQDGEEAFYDDEMNYERVSHADLGHGALWTNFCEVVTFRERFFNDKAKDFLAEIFKNIHLQRDAEKNFPVYVMNPADDAPIFFRARETDTAGMKAIVKDPEAQMGPPPRRLGKPNRMNPSGVPAVYAALDAETCVSELRPRVGGKIALASFTLLRPICVLDTTRFKAPPKELNIFAKDHSRRLSQWRFMQNFMTEIAKPISPADEHIDYVPTQVVADYLNNQHPVYMGKSQTCIEAIIYNSAQRPGGRNIVLLGDAAIVKPSSKTSAEKPTSDSYFIDWADFTRMRNRAPCIALVEKSLTFIEVEAASFKTRTISEGDNDPSVLDISFDPFEAPPLG